MLILEVDVIGIVRHIKECWSECSVARTGSSHTKDKVMQVQERQWANVCFAIICCEASTIDMHHVAL